MMIVATITTFVVGLALLASGSLSGDPSRLDPSSIDDLTLDNASNLDYPDPALDIASEVTAQTSSDTDPPTLCQATFGYEDVCAIFHPCPSWYYDVTACPVTAVGATNRCKKWTCPK